MVAQLQAQNPLEPTNDTEYIAELAQFSQLEQTTNIAQTSSQAATSQQVAQAVGLIGHTVSYIDPTTGASTQGKVQNVEIGSTGATLTIEGIAGHRTRRHHRGLVSVELNPALLPPEPSVRHSRPARPRAPAPVRHRGRPSPTSSRTPATPRTGSEPPAPG